LARGLGLASDFRMAIGIDVLEEAEKLCVDIAKEFPKAVFFANKLIFQDERWYQRVLHNETAYQLQRRLQFAGLYSMVLPGRVFANQPAPLTGHGEVPRGPRTTLADFFHRLLNRRMLRSRVMLDAATGLSYDE